MSEKNNQSQQNEEVDLGNIFIIIGKGFQKIFAFIGLIFKTIYDFIILILTHIFKRKWWYLATGVIGIALGIYLDQTKEKTFAANMYVETNFNSAAEVYENVYYLNQLSKNKDHVSQLVKKLNITEDQAKSIMSFDIEPIINENERVELFSDFKNELDSLSQENLVYDDYKNTLTDISYKRHKIEIQSTDQFVFKEIGKKISSMLINNEYLEKFKNSNNEAIQEEINNLDRLEKQIDSLVNTYLTIRQKEADKQPSNNSGTNLYMADANSNSLLIDESKLILKKTELKQRKTYLKEKLLETDNVVNIIGQLPEAGYNITGILGLNMVRIPLLFFTITLLIFSFYGLFKYLETKVKN